MSNELSINNQAAERTVEALEAAIAADVVVISDGESGEWERAAFIEAAQQEHGHPCGDYTTFTAAEWAAEIAANTQD